MPTCAARRPICYTGSLRTKRKSSECGLEFGFDRQHTLQEIGREFALTRERIRQIETKALQALRDPRFVPQLRELLASQV